MADNTDDQDFPQQPPLGKHRAVLTADGKPVVALEQDGVVTLHKLRTVPDALWNSEFWDTALPEWAEGVADPPSQFLAIIVDRVGRQRIAIAELEILVPALRELRREVRRRRRRRREGEAPTGRGGTTSNLDQQASRQAAAASRQQGAGDTLISARPPSILPRARNALMTKLKPVDEWTASDR